MKAAAILARLTALIAPQWRGVEARPLQALADAGAAWWERQEAVVRGDDESLALAAFLRAEIAGLQEEIEALHRLHGEFVRRHAQALLREERQFAVLEYARRLGATRGELRADRRAFDRWFDFDAVGDRQQAQVAACERRAAVALRCLGGLAAELVAAAPDAAQAQALWQRLAVEASVRPLFLYAGNPRLRIEAFQALARAFAAWRNGQIAGDTVHFVFRCALDSDQDVWLQCEAIGLLQVLSPAAFREVVAARLARPQPGDSLFVRRHAVLLCGAELQRGAAGLAELVAGAAGDPSPYVRQAVAQALMAAPPELRDVSLRRLVHEDPVAAVRAAALLQLATLALQDAARTMAADCLTAALAREDDAFVLRVGLHVAAVVAESLADAPAAGAAWCDRVAAAIAALIAAAPDLRVRRWAAATRERLWVAADPQRRAAAAALRERLAQTPPGTTLDLPATALPGTGDAPMRLLASLTQRDFPLDLARRRGGWRIRRGHRFGFRLWRALHEFRHPSPDKRQAHPHTTGRIFDGDRHIASGILAELAETKVPGEPLHCADEDGWRPYLPLVDELISAIDLNSPQRPLSIHCADGVTEVRPPAAFAARLRARSVLTWRFAHYARLRNWQADSQHDPASYLRELARLGFVIDFRPHGEAADSTARDNSVTRFFPATGIVGSADLWQRLQHYFVSAFDNTLFELSIFVAACSGLFIGRHLWLNRNLRRARERLPLVIGGWGTRGKSGTERIKAALFNALGYSVVSKTTGCEAMFLHGHAYGELREMFLFRPYDKATIWEQYDVVKLATELNCEVFLWECMALTPAFVRILQQSWMRDDLSTLTNTFPDHEDIQGPAGKDIPDVMTEFIPRARTLVTSEAQMLPVLQHAATTRQTRLRAVDWLAPGLLAPDVLARFPYQEHPDNIALVVAVADELGIDEAFALKEMADRVVPDLGVLKTYPAANVDGRMISFVNGMSANERFGCLGNWRRVGFDRCDAYAEPGVFISTVVNNRADRIARSRVFAGVLVADIAADRHFLIGSNLSGLQGYIREAWQAWVAEVTLRPADGRAPTEVLAEFARRLRIVHRPADVEARLRAMFAGQGLADAAALARRWRTPAELTSILGERGGAGAAHAQATLAQLAEDTRTLAEYEDFAGRVQASSSLDGEFRALLWSWFQRKFVVIEDFHASGDQVIQTIARHTPPGIANRVMGIQNIKGTGLDFVYRWQAWDACAKACEQVLDDDPRIAAHGLAALARFGEFGILCEDRVQAVIVAARQRIEFQQDRHQAEITQIAQRLRTQLDAIRETMAQSRRAGVLERLCDAVEGFVDAGDAIRRRAAANRIYEDLVTHRISHTRAARELQTLNRRQKGGWLYAALAAALARLASTRLGGGDEATART